MMDSGLRAFAGITRALSFISVTFICLLILLLLTSTDYTYGTGRLGTIIFAAGLPGERNNLDIFVSDEIKVVEYAVLDDTYGEENRRPSDHMPVLVVATFSGG